MVSADVEMPNTFPSMVFTNTTELSFESPMDSRTFKSGICFLQITSPVIASSVVIYLSGATMKTRLLVATGKEAAGENILLLLPLFHFHNKFPLKRSRQ